MTEKIGCVQHDCAECVAREQRPWVGLTDEDKDEIIRVTESDHYHDILMLAEAKLKENNT